MTVYVNFLGHFKFVKFVPKVYKLPIVTIGSSFRTKNIPLLWPNNETFTTTKKSRYFVKFGHFRTVTCQKNAPWDDPRAPIFDMSPF